MVEQRMNCMRYPWYGMRKQNSHNFHLFQIEASAHSHTDMPKERDQHILRKGWLREWSSRTAKHKETKKCNFSFDRLWLSLSLIPLVASGTEKKLYELHIVIRKYENVNMTDVHWGRQTDKKTQNTHYLWRRLGESNESERKQRKERGHKMKPILRRESIKNCRICATTFQHYSMLPPFSLTVEVQLQAKKFIEKFRLQNIRWGIEANWASKEWTVQHPILVRFWFREVACGRTTC